MSIARGRSESVADVSNDCRIIHAWLSAYLSDKPLSSLRRISEWQAWATARLKGGWTVDAIKQHVVDRWTQHARMTGLDKAPRIEPGSDLYRELSEGYHEAENGAKPTMLAVLYRSLATAHPEHPFLSEYANELSLMGEQWKEIVR